MKPTIRGSSLPQLMSCSNSILNPDNLVRVEGENETAQLGTDVHALCEATINDGVDNLMTLKQRYSEGDFARAAMLYRNFLVVWKEATTFMDEPKTEVFIQMENTAFTLTGNLDVLDDTTKKDEAFILDFKTGRQHEDHYHQMAGYATLVWSRKGYPTKYKVSVTTVYLEDLTITNYVFDAAGMIDWLREVGKQLSQPRYTAGRKCAFCALQGSCPGYTAYTRGAVQMFTDDFTVAGAVWADMTADQRGALVDKMYVVEKAIDRVKLSLRNKVRAEGAVDVGGGKEYTLVEQEEKQLNTVRALPILLKRIGAGNVKSLSRIPLDSALAAFAGKAGKGLKTQARKKLFEELDKAGAIVRTKTTKMYRRPVGEKVLDV